MNDDVHKKGYWIYSCVAIIFCMALFAFVGYLIYDLVIKLSEKDFSNNTVVQALITLVITVFIGGYFSKWLERRNAKKLCLYQTRIDISLKLIDLSSEFYRGQNETLKNMLIFESSKVKLFFNDDTLKYLNKFIESNKKDMLNNYNSLIDKLKENIK